MASSKSKARLAKVRPFISAFLRLHPPAPCQLVQQLQSHARGDETILLVEDDKAVRAVTEATLVQQGYQVIAASNGEQALEAFRRNPNSFHLLLTDVVMPGMSGRQLAELVRQIRGDIPFCL